MRRITLLSMLAISLVACDKQSRVTVLLENESEIHKVVDATVYVDGKEKGGSLLKFTGVTPNFYTIAFDVDYGEGKIRIAADDHQAYRDTTITIVDDIFIIGSFKYRIKPESMYEMEKFKFDIMYPKEDYPDKVFEYDSIATPMSFEFMITNELPMLH
ncbi:MAG: hypothetical protein AAF149_11890 [Bacteroidota bacterium]